MRPRFGLLAALTLVAGLAPPAAPAAALAPVPPGLATGLVLVDPATAEWHLVAPDGTRGEFTYGVAGDVPLLGDWDCDGVDTPGMFRPTTGFVYLSDRNVTSVADIEFFLGIPGDVPVAGDWDGDGCDSVGVYRDGAVFLRNSPTTGRADAEFSFGVPGDRPFSGDFDGDGVSTLGLYRESSGFTYLRTTNTSGIADAEFFFGEASDAVVAGDWDGDGTVTIGIYRPSERRFYLTNRNAQGEADLELAAGQAAWIPLAGELGVLDPSIVVADTAIESRAAWTDRAPIPALLTPHQIQRLTVHHSGDSSSQNGPPRFRAWQAWHVDGLGWGDLAYHYIVGQDGTIYEARPASFRGDTATSYDPTGHLLFVLEGNFQVEEPSAAQVEALGEALAWAAAEYGVDPATIAGHRDHSNDTLCPGDHLHELLPDITARVQDLL